MGTRYAEATPASTPRIHGYAQRSFHATIPDGTAVTHDVYERGESPTVVLVQELPGIGPQTLHLADRLVSAGYHVVLPHLFGPLGRVSFVGNIGRVLCMRRELRMFASHQSSPVVAWLRALCRDVRERRGVAGVGVIGMCLTGNFAITLIADDAVLAAAPAGRGGPSTRECMDGHSDLHSMHGLRAVRRAESLRADDDEEREPSLRHVFDQTAYPVVAIDARWHRSRLSRRAWELHSYVPGPSTSSSEAAVSTRSDHSSSCAWVAASTTARWCGGTVPKR